MKAYGRNRVNTFECPDCADIRNMGAKSSVGNLRGKGGDYRSSFKRPAAKAAIRRIYKRAARAEGKAECLSGLHAEEETNEIRAVVRSASYDFQCELTGRYGCIWVRIEIGGRFFDHQHNFWNVAKAERFASRVASLGLPVEHFVKSECWKEDVGCYSVIATDDGGNPTLCEFITPTLEG